MRNRHSPDYLIIGHIAKDRTPRGDILGGTCSYAALTAHKLGQRTVAVTSYGPDVPSLAALDGVQIENVPHTFTTHFENIYQNNKRLQKWSETGASLSYGNVPPPWRNTPIVHIAPIAQEISPAMCARFQDSLLCVTGQGWLRGRDRDYNVIYKPHPDLALWLSSIDVLVISRNDLFGERTIMNHIQTSVCLAVETLGPEGCKVYHKGRASHIPIKPEIEVDPTGAGDIFAAAFFIRYREGGDFIKAAQFANACASLSVRKVGLESVPSLSAAEKQAAKLYGR